MTRAHRFVALLLALLSVLVVIAGRVPRARADAAEEARFHDELARRHYAARRYEQAIREFFLERDLAPNARVTFNIALCFDELHRDADAYLSFAEYLAGDDVDPERRRLAEAAVARLAPRVALVSVTSDPAGATVYLDRREHGGYGVTPVVLAVDEGAHTLLLERDGWSATELSIRAVRGQRIEVRGALARVEGPLEVRAPEGATVEVHDAAGATVARGTGTLRASLPPGDYDVEVRSEGFEPWRSLTRVTREASAPLVPELVARAVPSSELTITASAAGATIEIDGEVSGFTPAVLERLPLGEHRVRVSHPGLVPWEGAVSVDADVRRWLTVSLAPPTETRRSELTWVVGGAAVASLVVGATLGGLGLDALSRFQSIELQARDYAMGTGPAPTGSLLDARAQGITLASGADVAFVAAGTLAIVAVVLYFTTETTSEQASSASVADGERSGSDEGDEADEARP